MTVAERRAMLGKNPTAKMIWIVLLILEGLGLVAALLVGLFLVLLAGGLSGSALVTLFTVGILILMVGLSALIFFGILRLERWVQWLAWVNAALSIPSLLSKDSSFYIAIFPILVAVGYTYILRAVYPRSTTTIPPTTPPAM